MLKMSGVTNEVRDKRKLGMVELKYCYGCGRKLKEVILEEGDLPVKHCRKCNVFFPNESNMISIHKLVFGDIK